MSRSPTSNTATVGDHLRAIPHMVQSAATTWAGCELTALEVHAGQRTQRKKRENRRTWKAHRCLIEVITDSCFAEIGAAAGAFTATRRARTFLVKLPAPPWPATCSYRQKIAWFITATLRRWIRMVIGICRARKCSSSRHRPACPRLPCEVFVERARVQHARPYSHG